MIYIFISFNSFAPGIEHIKVILLYSATRRLSSLIEGGEVQDETVWVPIAAEAKGSGNSTALVGTPDQVAEAIAKYYDLGISGVLIRGFDPFNDAIEYGKELIPSIREKVAERDSLKTATIESRATA